MRIPEKGRVAVSYLVSPETKHKIESVAYKNELHGWQAIERIVENYIDIPDDCRAYVNRLAEERNVEINDALSDIIRVHMFQRSTVNEIRNRHQRIVY